MRVHPLRRTVLACVATVSAGVLMLSLKPHTAPPAPTALPAPSASSGAKGQVQGSGQGHGRRTVTGSVAQTPYGPVQVQITLDGSRITTARALQTPNDRPRSQDIASYSVPVLNRETLDAQSAHIDAVSGATYTSQGYVTSLQSALDRAHG